MDKKKVVEKMEGCNINFSKLENRSIKVFNDKDPVKGIEIIGERGKYSVYTDPGNKKFSDLRGKSGNLKEIKKIVSGALCGKEVAPAVNKAENSAA